MVQDDPVLCRVEIRPLVRRMDEARNVQSNPTEDTTMKFLMMIKHSESCRSEPIPQGLLDAMGTFVQQGFASGVLKDTAGLKGDLRGLSRPELHRVHWPSFVAECEVRPLEDM